MYPTHITHYLDATIADHEARDAVRQGERTLNFAALRESALAWAGRISERLGGVTGRIVAVLLPKGVDAVLADLAILYSGNAYLNLDVRAPRQRQSAILAQTGAALLIAGASPAAGTPAAGATDTASAAGPGADAATLAAACAAGLLVLGAQAPAPPAVKERDALLALRRGCIDLDPCCVITTSGSTGAPKAVALSHRAFIDFIEAVRADGLVADNEVVGSLSPVAFDIFSFELCMLMAWGSTLVLLPGEDAAFPLRLLEAMARHGVTFIFWVPTIMVTIASMDLLAHVPLPALRMVWFAGEVFPTARCNYWRRHLPQATFANFYGPVEITLDCVRHVLRGPLADSEPVPIGTPFRNTAVLVLDERDAAVGPERPGVAGELCVRGASLALGYCNNPGATAAAFTQNPLNSAWPERIYRTGDMVAWNASGELVFLGRRDTLIKHRGYRIELAEIEHLAVTLPDLAHNCCALYDADRGRIVLVYEAPAPIPPAQWRRRLGEVLPRYMLPARYCHLPELPRNANGKIDRRLLAERLRREEPEP